MRKTDYSIPLGGILLALVVVLLMAMAASCEASPAARAASCRVTVSEGNARSLGTGTLIDRTEDGREGLILTCAHLFDSPNGGIVVTLNGKQHRGRLLQIDRNADLAAISIANPNVAPVRINPEPSKQDTFQSYGYGGDGVIAHKTGRWVADAKSDSQESMVTSFQVRSGTSGAGLFDYQGNLVGVVWGATNGQSYTSRGRPLLAFLQRVVRGPRYTGLFSQPTTIINCPTGNCPTAECPTGTCPLIPRPQPTPALPRPQPQPQPQPTQPERSICPNCNCEARIAQLESRLASLETQQTTIIARLDQIVVPTVPGADEVASRVVTMLPPIRFEHRDGPNGNVLDVTEVHLGETLPLWFTPKGRSYAGQN